MSAISDIFASQVQQAGYASNAYGTANAKNAKGTGRTKDTAKTEEAKETGKTNETSEKKVTKGLGQTIGDVSLSEKAAAYYKDLKSKFKGMNFILVSSDRKDEVDKNASKYATAAGTTVLIDVDKIERMAEDEDYRKKYEGIIGNAANDLARLASSMSSGSSSIPGLIGYGAKINDDGTSSFFAVVDKSLAAQSDRIAEKRAEKKAEKKAADKKAAKKAQEEKREEKLEEKRAASRESRRTEKDEKGTDKARQSKPEDRITITADSVDELLKKVSDTVMSIRADSILTPQEEAVGQHFDLGI